jgi:uncharacterized membrane protein
MIPMIDEPTSTAQPHRQASARGVADVAISRPGSVRLLALPGILLCALLAAAAIRRTGAAGSFWPSAYGIWVAIHVATVVPAVPLGAYVLARRKGDALHRLLGRIWAMLMLATAFTSFAIQRMTGQFSPIHLLSILVIVTMIRGIHFARTRDIRRHRRSMALAYVGLITAGLFTFLPGRLFGDWLMG